MIWSSNKIAPAWIFVASVLVFMMILQLFDIRYFRYQNDWYSEIEYWRIFSAHWIHYNWLHLALNAAGLILCTAIALPSWSIGRWIVYNLILAVGISVLFTLRNPELGWYVGYSGVLFGIFLLAAIDLYRRERLIAMLLGGGICVKVILEQTSSVNVTSSELIGTPVIVDAHLYGLVSALLIALGCRVYTIYAGSKKF